MTDRLPLPSRRVAPRPRRDANRNHPGASVQSRTIHGRIDDRAAAERPEEPAGLTALLRDCALREHGVYLFGSDSRTIYALRERVASAFPTVRIAGVCDADFVGPVDRAVLDHIRAANADLIMTDLPQARFRLFSAQCAAGGIYGRPINLPGSFTDFAFSPGQGLSRFSLPARLRRFGIAAKAGLRFARIILGQSLRQMDAARAAAVPRRRRS